MENDVKQSSEEKKDPNAYRDFKNPKNDGSLIAGILLITVGGLFLITRFIPRINFGDLWPVLLIVVGVIIIFGSTRSKNKS